MSKSTWKPLNALAPLAAPPRVKVMATAAGAGAGSRKGPETATSARGEADSQLNKAWTMSAVVKGIEPSVRQDVASRPTGHQSRPFAVESIRPSEPKLAAEKLLKEIPAPPVTPVASAVSYLLMEPTVIELPVMGELVPLPISKLSRPAKTTHESTLGLVQGLMPIIKPASSLKPQAYTREKTHAETALREKSTPRKRSGFALFWSKAPADLKWITLSLPVILCVWFFTATKAQRNAIIAGKPATELAGMASPVIEPVAVAQTVEAVKETPVPVEKAPAPQKQNEAVVAFPKSVEPTPEVTAKPAASSFSAGMEKFQKNLKLRASVAFEEDFHSGLSQWSGRRNWASSWGYDSTGLVRAGQMAIYKPSENLTDYYFEITTSLDRRSVGWIYRAKDLENYYASRLVVTRPGPVPTIALERYAVINGKATKVQQIAIPTSSRGDTIFTIAVQATGNTFTTYWQGQIVDSYSDDKLSSGGVGLYAPRGEESRIFRVSVTHNNDWFGRLCSMLAPTDTKTSGSVTQ